MPLYVKKSAPMHVDEGEYDAVITNIEQKDGKHSEYYLWSFVLKDATQDGEILERKAKLTGITSATFSPNSKLYKWLIALGLDVAQDQIDIESLIKSRVRIYVEDKEAENGQVWSQVAKVRKVKGKDSPAARTDDEDEMPPKQAKKPAPKKAKQEEEEDLFDDDAEEKPKSKKAAQKETEDDLFDEEEEAPKKAAKKSKKEEDDEDLFEGFDD